MVATSYSFGRLKKRPTKRAPDAGDSGAIPSLFLRLSIFPVGRLRRPRPSAGNANRWATPCMDVKNFREYFMKIKPISNDKIFTVLLIGTGFAALYIGFETHSHYPNVVQGIYGLATSYLIYLFYFPPKNFIRNPVGIELEFPRIIKHILPTFFMYMIIMWSALYIVDAIYYLLRMFTKN